MAEMIHFMRQLEAYCHLEVIECSWQDLMNFVLKKEGDLDALIETHRAYLDRMVKKVLLLSPKAGREENLLNQVRDVFTLILHFREATVSTPQTDNVQEGWLNKDSGRPVQLLPIRVCKT